MDFDAVILAGGRARRLAGADKPSSLIGGRRLIDIALAAVAGAQRIVVVGPDRDLPAQVITAREDPPFAGPVAAVDAGLAALGTLPDGREIAVLAADLPFVSAEQIGELAARRRAVDAPVALAVDEAGHTQYLLGVWRADALRAALSTADASMRSLVPAGVLTVPLADTDDIDTAEDLALARLRTTPLQRVADALAPLHSVASRTVDVDDALGAVLAVPLVAATPFPAFDTAAMDGYAVRGAAPWQIVGAPVRAGHAGDPLNVTGTAALIATGAPLPPGADRVIRVEETTVLDDGLITETTVGRDDTRRRGESWAAGDELAEAGTVVDAAVIGTAKAAGVARLSVRGPLRAVVHSSGDEVGSTGSSGIVDTASLPVREVLARLGAQVSRGAHLPDATAALRTAVGPDRAPGEVIVVIGATGRGSADLLRAALLDVGATVLLDGIDVRPGGSLLIAALPDGGVLLGLGGNPVAALCGAALCAPVIRRLLLQARPDGVEQITVTNATELSHPQLSRIVPVRSDGGRWVGSPVKSTADLRSLIGAHALALLAPAGYDGALRLL
ncbi:MAG TPA: NTP transferase domain-containing protein [Gordonia sp. (in: high G+C Gram-positive bacteria)]|uniref:NTP transferase domain-containing protein n=1 Tax=unclassified Gordonia (in: high G+C Gram-positive bacteria) TaxID=2657482 RepID=UPI0025C732B0|nr:MULTISPECIES: NTP transferase domain-containing protein [unclassified Gordonia (in: high G+C Gram-positive bacteria)]HNP57494.1 NTP transferase domain-containing protein [Gordonia sp. (in: high G+C Gram-positive bacteria)]HRC51370.1 NTP transferase domain-containing protein [Gordonia sp. (in: high G+C Gram-positive bacteria)]